MSSQRCDLLVVLLLLLSLGPAAHAQDTDFKIVGYLSGRGLRKIDELELDKLTHLNLAFANPDQEGNLVFRAERRYQACREERA